MGAPAGFAGAVVVTRALTQQGRGTFVLAQLAATAIATALSGVGTALVGHARDNDAAWRATSRAAIAVTGVIATVCAVPVAFGLLSWQPHLRTGVCLIAAAAPLLALTQSCTVLVLAGGDLRSWGQVVAAQNGLPVAGLAVAAAVHRSFTALAAGWVAGQLLSTSAAVVTSRAVWSRATDDERVHDLPGLARRAGLVGAANAVSLANYRIDVALLATLRGVRAAAVYSLAVALAELVWIPSSTWAASLVARLRTDGPDEAARRTARVVRGTVVLSVATGAVGFALAAWLISPIFGAAYHHALAPLAVLLCGTIAFAPASVLAQYLTISLGRPGATLRAALLAATTTAVLTLVLVPLWGATGAAVATSLGYAAGVAVGVQRSATLGVVHKRDLVPQTGDVRELVRSVSRRHAR
ncbi:MAG TPA: polysaccharide biosynthesis C-terminal domain-containing protein [Mycobacteriales bacterium]|nr:polysaccharide biosynthesis C-terminal domain-containing protein [Mycobacteriales bacterium]